MSADAAIASIVGRLEGLLEALSLVDDAEAASKALEGVAATALQWRELVDESARLARAMKEGQR